MKVILQQRVKDLGEPGQIVTVAPGYARNFLIPRGLAVEATKENLSKLKHQEQVAKRQQERALAEAKKAAGDLAQLEVVIPAKAGQSGRLFGSVTSADIAKAIRAATGHNVDRRKILLEEPIREVGSTRVDVRLHPEVTVSVTVTVTPQS